jgi:DegV family protein with EDD domain
MIDLPPEVLDELGISTISCFIHMGGKSYSDMDDITPADVFANMDKTGEIAKTAARSPEMYEEFFMQFVDRGDTVLHLACSSGISSICANAKTAASRHPDKIFVVDTLKLCGGIALLAHYAIWLIEGGMTDVGKIAELLEKQRPYVQASFLLNTLECLYRGGRASGMQYYASNIFRIRPSIYMNPVGNMVVREKYHGNMVSCVRKYVETTFTKYPNPVLDRLYVASTTVNPEMEQFMIEQVALYHKFKTISISRPGCNCCVHGGKHTVGLFFIQQS